VFPAEKYRRIRDRFAGNLALRVPKILFVPEPASDQDILLVHTPAVCREAEKLARSSPREEMELEIPYSPELVRAFWLAGGRIDSRRAATLLNDGVAVSIGGGFHHAFPDHGEGFCMIHRRGLSPSGRMQRDGKIRTRQ